MTPVTAKRKRRRARQRLKFGIAAVRRHKRVAGRTGQIAAKMPAGKVAGYSVQWENPAVHIDGLGGPLF